MNGPTLSVGPAAGAASPVGGHRTGLVTFGLIGDACSPEFSYGGWCEAAAGAHDRWPAAPRVRPPALRPAPQPAAPPGQARRPRPNPPRHGGEVAPAAALGAGRGPARRGPGAVPGPGRVRGPPRDRLPIRLPGRGNQHGEVDHSAVWRVERGPRVGRHGARGRPGLRGGRRRPRRGRRRAHRDRVLVPDRRTGVAGHAGRLPGRGRHRVGTRLAG
jgi:hypothetical protein